ncbi:MAG: M15 family metallopeptidase [Pseudobutyrivibrio sp.]|nr:M15 family metallopeptidase [Pseudobutyrivibrio sp.]
MNKRFWLVIRQGIIVSLVFSIILIGGCKKNSDIGKTSEVEFEVETDTDSNSKLDESSDKKLDSNSDSSSGSTGDTADFYQLEFSRDSDIFARINGKSYKADCTIPLSDLRYLHVLYIGFDNETHQGEIICNKAIADDLLEIFEELYDNSYQIEKIALIDEYGADDEASMEANNTSCFNYRTMTNSTKVSKHGQGLAIDINPLYNPYVKGEGESMIVEPTNALEYVDRTKSYPGKISHDDLAYQLFTAHGFSWGGDWNSLKDYQHFEK